MEIKNELINYLNENEQEFISNNNLFLNFKNGNITLDLVYKDNVFKYSYKDIEILELKFSIVISKTSGYYAELYIKMKQENEVRDTYKDENKNCYYGRSKVETIKEFNSEFSFDYKTLPYKKILEKVMNADLNIYSINSNKDLVNYFLK